MIESGLQPLRLERDRFYVTLHTRSTALCQLRQRRRVELGMDLAVLAVLLCGDAGMLIIGAMLQFMQVRQQPGSHGKPGQQEEDG